jgi:hypothetical protein
MAAAAVAEARSRHQTPRTSLRDDIPMTNEERRPPERPIPEYLDSDYRYVVTIGFEEEVDIRREVEALGGTVLQEQIWGEWETEWTEAAQIEQPWWKRLLARLRLVR